MFGINTIAQDITEAATPDCPSKVDVKPGQEQEKEILALAKRLGLDHGEYCTQELEAFLRDEGIRVYSTVSVRDYLVEKNNGNKFKLFPARESDVPSVANHKLWVNRIRPVKFWDSCDSDPAVYRAVMPYPVLLTMEKLVNKFGQDARFYIAAIDADPFLAVALKDSIMIFIERWDEAGYREG